MKKRYGLCLLCTTVMLGSTTPGFSATLFQENFEDSNFSSRGWYDSTSPKLSTVEHIANSTKSLEVRFGAGATTPDNLGTSMRKKFTETDSVYLSYYVKYSSNWQGSNVGYHPHEFYFLTNKDGDWSGLSYTHLTTYVEQNEGKPQVGIQDGMNIDLANIGKDLTATTERRGVAGCNGDSDGYGNGECYPNGGAYWNGKWWRSPSVMFSDAAGPTYKSDWHLVEVYIKMNSIVNGKAAKDGIIQYSYDGKSVIDARNVVIRTGQYADMKFNQLLIGPYIGVGSPVTQSFWIDNLTIATAPPTVSTIAAPQGLRVISK